MHGGDSPDRSCRRHLRPDDHLSHEADGRNGTSCRGQDGKLSTTCVYQHQPAFTSDLMSQICRDNPRSFAFPPLRGVLSRHSALRLSSRSRLFAKYLGSHPLCARLVPTLRQSSSCRVNGSAVLPAQPSPFSLRTTQPPFSGSFSFPHSSIPPFPYSHIPTLHSRSALLIPNPQSLISLRLLVPTLRLTIL